MIGFVVFGLSEKERAGEMSVLVVGAHPDDEVLGCGGTVARMAKEGEDVFVAILGEGITSRYAQREQAGTRLVKELRKRCQQVAELLGVRDLFLYDLPDNSFDTVPLLGIVKIIEDLIDRLQPVAIYTHHGGDLNVDHNITFRATLTAARPVPGCSVRDIYAFEVLSSTEWAFGELERSFKPNLFVEIGQTLDLKIEAMGIYETEARSYPHPRSPESIKASAMRWGCTIGVNAAEAFGVVRSVR